MTNWQRSAALVSAAAAVTMIAGCSTDGTATSESSTQSTTAPVATSSSAPASVDVAALNTGSYPTSPRPPFGETTHDNLLQVEGQRMAQYIVVPFEVDQDLTNSAFPTMVITGRSTLRPVLPAEVVAVPANNNLVGGFVAAATTPGENLRDGQKRSLNNMVVRYLTPADAKAAAQQMAAALAASEKTTVSTLPGLPDTQVVRVDADGKSRIVAFTPHNNYVLYQWYETGAGQKSKLEPTVRSLITQQSTLIDQFPYTPTKAESAAGNPNPTKVLVDQNHILIYALPYTDEQLKKSEGTGAPSATIRAVYGPRGMAQISADPPNDLRLLTDVGSTANAVERSNVYRANTDDGADTIVDSLASSARNRGFSEIADPPGLSPATCLSDTSGSTPRVLCLVQVGRYVGEVKSTNQQDAYQQISAQYVILTKADQRAN
ncbi:hypothetical protein AAFP30_19575 [Gordonia sp. CPCC 205515]|uniref:DUF7373 family lipoprotein n=1 Tax=Gordonia sp. CPCC 205515 TaxID=3140791 RepID=UPI003AF3AC3B